MVRSHSASLTHSPDRLRLDALAILRAAIDAVDPRPLVASALADPARAGSPVAFRVISAGKAAVPMLRGVYEARGVRVVEALVTSDGADEIARTPSIEYVGGSHPLPDAASVRAGRRALEIAARAREMGEPLLVLLSGGASSMLALPADGISLDGKRRAIDAMLRAGAEIAQLNCVRKHLSSIKGGRLAGRAGRVLTLAISDVHDPEDDAATIGSGPTAADPTTFADALAILDRLACEVPAAVRAHLQRGANGEFEETLKPGDPRLDASEYQVVANRWTAMDGAAREATLRGYAVRTVAASTRGEAREAGRIFVEGGLLAAGGEPLTCVIASGEPTVTVRGNGVGGRNQEFVLGALHPLTRHQNTALVASIGTDGIDGPTTAAGAIASSTTLAAMQTLGIDVDEVLARNDAYPALARVEGLINTGPTGTNVGDVHLLLTMRQ